MRSIKDWFFRVLDKIESYIPERLLTHKAKIRRIVALEEKEAEWKQIQARLLAQRKKASDKRIKDSTMDLIASADQHSSSQPSASY